MIIFSESTRGVSDESLSRDRSESTASVDVDSVAASSAALLGDSPARPTVRRTPNTDPGLRRLRSGSESFSGGGGSIPGGSSTALRQIDGIPALAPLRMRSVSFAESRHTSHTAAASSSTVVASPSVSSDQYFSVSSLFTLPLRFSEFFALSSGSGSGSSSGGDSGTKTGSCGASNRITELGSLSAFERLLICAQSFSAEHYKNQAAVTDWVRFQSVLLEECLAEASSLLVLNAGSRTMKPFYASSAEVAEERRMRIADLFRSESLRVFRLPSTVTFPSFIFINFVRPVNSVICSPSLCLMCSSVLWPSKVSVSLQAVLVPVRHPVACARWCRHS